VRTPRNQHRSEDPRELPGLALFGRSMRASFGMPRAPVLEVRDLRLAPLAVTELRFDAHDFGRSAPVPEQDAVLVSWQLRTNPKHDIWEDGKRLPIEGLADGMTSIYDLRRSLTAYSRHPFHTVSFALPVQWLDEASGDAICRLELGRAARLGLSDPIVGALGSAIVPALRRPEATSRLFVDHVLLALRAHVASRFGDRLRRSARRGGLSAWQERRATELIDARLGGTLALAELARECQLSVAQFSRAFRHSTGMPPHRYLTDRRVERARLLLLHSDLPLADVAVKCGFADQSHFTKVFRRWTGVSPGSLRTAPRFETAPKPHGSEG
jgi:AraC family transcriptional regulator